MFGIRFARFNSMTHVIHYKNGKVVREGRGLAFFHYAPSSSIVAIPLESTDLPFVFNQTTGDYQTVAIQGQLSYRVSSPRLLADLLDFTVDARGFTVANVREKLDQRLVNQAQMAITALVQAMSLKDALRSASTLATAIHEGLAAAPALKALGVEPLAVTIAAVSATPETARALEAERREALLQDADLAVYARRNTAVEQERRIKESELNTEIAVEEKKKKIRETQMDAELLVEEKRRQVREVQVAADVAVEEKRRSLVELAAANRQKESEAQGYALAQVLKPVAGVDWRTLLALGKGTDPALIVSLAFQELAQNAARIGNLNVSPELLETLLDRGAGARGNARGGTGSGSAGGAGAGGAAARSQGGQGDHAS